MKKIFISLIVMLTIILTISAVKATKETLAEELYAKFKEYGATEAEKVKVERYLSENEVTDEQAKEILNKADEIIEVIKTENVRDVTKLSKEAKNKIKKIAQEAANIIELKLVFYKNKVEIYSSKGKLIEVVTMSNAGKLAYTGNNILNTSVYLVVLMVLVTIFIEKNKVGV